MSPWVDTIVTALANSIFTAGVLSIILGFLGRSLVERWLSRNLEKYKAELQATHNRQLEKLRTDLRLSALEHEIRFAKLHEKRVEAIEELYRHFVEIQRSLHSLVSAMKSELLSESRDEKKAATSKSIEALWKYFEECRIYFSEDLCSKIREFYRQTQLSNINLMSADILQNLGQESTEDIEKASNILSNEVSRIRGDIEKNFRQLLGGSDMNNNVSTLSDNSEEEFSV